MCVCLKVLDEGYICVRSERQNLGILSLNPKTLSPAQPDHLVLLPSYSQCLCVCQREDIAHHTLHRISALCTYTVDSSP